MTLKIAINGEKKSIAGRTSRPVVFINGEKKRLTKGVTFINGEKKYLWGTENKFEVFSFVNDIFSGYSPKPIYLDEKRLVLIGSTTTTSTSSKKMLGIFDITNSSLPTTMNSYNWGTGGLFNDFNVDKTIFSATDSPVINKITYNSGANNAVVNNAYTITRPDSNSVSSLGVGTMLDNGDFIWVWSKNIQVRPSVMNNYYVYKNNTQIASLGYNTVSFKQNCGNYILATYGSSTGHTSLYKLTGSGFGSAVYTDSDSLKINSAIKDGDYFMVLTNETCKRLNSSFSVVWATDLYEWLGEPTSVTRTAKTLSINFIGKGSDNKYYLLIRQRKDDWQTSREEEVVIKTLDVDTGEVSGVYPFNHYDSNGNLITNWACGGYISNSGYLPMIHKPSTITYEIYVARIFVG